jgi:glycosyltransferase involved in cell wall biosynthesis
MRILFALPGLHRVARGAEAAFIAVAVELCRSGHSVTLMGSGEAPPNAPYRFIHAGSLSRNRFEPFPSVPGLRNAEAYEELTFVPAVLSRFRPSDYDVTLTCGYPFTNWALRRPALRGRPPHVFITQNGDWPAYATNSEFRFFGCEGLVCINPDYYERNSARWNCRLIPNGVDIDRFQPGKSEREAFGLPSDRPIALMVSALIPSKRVDAGIAIVAELPDWHLVVAGDGPERQTLDAAAAARLGNRFTRLKVPPERMPALYRSADVFLHLSKDEPFALAFNEAMACGIPVVAHQSTRTKWFLCDVGFLVDTDDLAAAARQIRLAYQASPVRRQEGVELAGARSWTKVAEMYENFLREIVENHKATSSQPVAKQLN